MDTSARSALQQAASSTFECLGFLFVDEEPSEEQAAVGSLEASCRVRFRGPMSGALEMEVFGGVLGDLAANMIGRDEPPPPELCREALGEVANVVCGNVLPAIAGTHAVFDLSAPETGTEPVLRRPFAEDTVAVAVMGLGPGRVEIALRRYA